MARKHFGVWRVYHNQEYLGLVTGATPGEALEKARKRAGLHNVSIIKSRNFNVSELPKEDIGSAINHLLQIDVPWDRLNREDLVLVYNAVKSLRLQTIEHNVKSAR